MTRREDRTILVSVLAAVEVRSAIRRRQLQGDITPSDAEIAITYLHQETRRVIEHPVTESLVGIAHEVIDRQGLRALDAIQLASALAARQALLDEDQFTFIASDRKLLAAAEQEGFAVWNPARAVTT